MSSLHQPSAFDIVPWNPSFETGIDVIDEQHRRLVGLLNDLAHQYVYGLELAEVERIVDGLVDYTAYHFDTEEALWEEVLAGDKWFEAHKDTHDGFVQTVRRLQSELVRSKNMPALDDLLSFLTSWLAHHILYEDKRFSVLWLEMRGGHDLNTAKKKSLEVMSGQASGLIQSVLAMYKQLSTRTLALEREAYARKQAEQALREQDAHWTSVLGATNDILWDWDYAQLESVRQADQAVFLQCGQRIHPDDWPGLREDLLEHLLGQTDVFCHQHRVIEGDGDERWVQSRGKVIEQDENGRPVRMVGTQTDITDRKTAELTLQRDRDTRLLISEFAADFMASSPEDFDAAINRALQRGGEYIQADRVYVFLVTDDGQYMNNTHEWCAHGITPEIEHAQEIPCSSTPWWWQQLQDTGYVLIPRVSDMPHEARAEQAILQTQNVQSVCVYPLRMGKKLVGFLGSDAVTQERHWGRETLDFLGLMSDLLGIALDHRQLQQKRAQALARLERAEEQAHLGHWSFNLHTGEVTWSPEMFRIFEREPEQLAPDYDAYLEMIHPEERQRVHHAFKKAKDNLGSLQVEHRIMLDGGRTRHVEVRGQFEPGRNGCSVVAQGTLQDITEKALHREELRHQAFEDSLTGLPNRRALEDILVQQIAHCSNHKQRLVLGLLDLDNFREANERHGPAIGDAVLVALSRRMRLLFGTSAVIARVGGDEFVVLFTGLEDDEDCFLQINRLLAAIREPLTIEGVALEITASAGVTEYPQMMKVSAEQLVRQAQQALFEAKLQGKGRFQKYNVTWEQDTRAMTGRLQEIDRALHAEEFVLYYQPKVHMATGCVFGVEALIRWQQPSGRLISPGDFLPDLQGHPLEIELGDWVIHSALAQMRLWQARGFQFQVSVNVSSQQLLEEAFVDKLSAALDEYLEVAPAALQIEILESSALHDLEKVSRVMQRCRQLGVRFALDDFGTGFSSLAYLKHLPASVLKIDQSFVSGMLESADDLSIISGVVGMAQAFGLQVIAEGVESAEHGELLLKLGCEQAQGYGIARPMPAENLPEWIGNWQTEPSWSQQVPVKSYNLPLLYAEVEHRRWVKDLQQWLTGARETVPDMDHHQCRVGLWIDNEARSRFSMRPELYQLDRLHQDLHQLGRKALAVHAKGNTGQALAMLSDIRSLRDRFLQELRALIG